jgi:hypothetical protein
VHEDVISPFPELVEKYVEMGLPQTMADFICIVMEGKEGTATMSEVCDVMSEAGTLLLPYYSRFDVQLPKKQF